MPPRSQSLIRPLVAAVFCILPLCANAFEAVDQLTPSSSGRFPAYAQDPYPPSLFYVQAGGMVDSNVLRRSAGSPTEEIGRLGVGGRKDTYVYGRQMLRLEGRVDGYLYNHFSELDNLAYSGNGEYHWELGNDLSGVLGVSRSHYQRSLAQIQAAVRDMITETHYLANGAYRLGPSMRVRAGADRYDYHASIVNELRLRTNGGIVGLDYVTALGNFIGLEYRRATGDAPVSQRVDPLGLFVNNDYEEHSVGIAIGYVTPFLRLGGNVARTKRTYTVLPARDFEGTTWHLTADWVVTPKTALGFETYRAPQSIIDIATTHVVARGVAFGPGWAPTAKLSFSARVFRERQEFGGDPGTVVDPTVFPLRLEIIHGTRLGAYWEYTRQIHWTFAIDHGSRESNVLGRDFQYNAVIANVRYLFW